ncbi:hypothetical protein EI94DRAFT_1727650, partial [Lactarius quietus]
MRISTAAPPPAAPVIFYAPARSWRMYHAPPRPPPRAKENLLFQKPYQGITFLLAARANVPVEPIPRISLYSARVRASMASFGSSSSPLPPPADFRRLRRSLPTITRHYQC